MRKTVRALAVLALTSGGGIAHAQNYPGGGPNVPVGGGSGGGGSGTVTNILTTAPISGGPITSTGTISCPTCVASASALTANSLMIGSGSQASAVTPTAAGILTFLGAPSSANLANALTDKTGTGLNVFATAPTLNGPVVVNAGSFGLSGNISAPAWTTAGIRYNNVTATLTDTTSSGTVANARTDNFGGNTIAASSATTFTNYFSAYFTNPIAGTNVTLTNKSAVGADSISIGGAPQGANALAVTGTALFSSTISIAGTGSTVGIGLSGTDGFTLSLRAGGGSVATINNGAVFNLSSGGGYAINGSTLLSSSTLTLNGNAIATAPAAATLQHGAADAAAPVAQTIQVQRVVAGTSNTAGALWTFKDSAGTGTGASGGYAFQVAAAGSTGTSQNTYANALTIDSTKLVTALGALTVTGNLNTQDVLLANNKTLFWSAQGGIKSSADGVLQLRNNANTDFTSLQFGGTTSSFPALKRSGTTLAARLADDSADTAISASTATLSALASDAAQTDSTVCVNGSGLLLKGSGTLGICLGTSSLRYKQEDTIKPIVSGLDAVTALRPINYFYKPGHGDDGAREQYGFLAEDVVGVIPGLVALDAEGKPNSVDILGMVPVLVRALQEQQKQIVALTKQVENSARPSRATFTNCAPTNPQCGVLQ